MKPYHIIISALLTLGGTLDLRAGTNDRTFDPIFLRPQKPLKQDRPKAPCKQTIYCNFREEILSFTFALADGECQLTLTDTTSGIASEYSVDSSTLSAEVYVGTLSGSTEIELTTESGNTYIGTLL